MNLPKLDYKKVFLLLGFILTATFFGWLIFRIFFGAPITITTDNVNEEYDTNGVVRTPGELGPGGGLSGLVNNINSNVSPTSIEIDRTIAEITTKKVEKITTESIRGATLSQNNSNITFYSNDDGKFYEINSNGEKIPISEKVFYNIESVAWASDKNSAVIEYPDGSNIIYDFDTDKQKTLPLNWSEFNFSTNNNNIVTKSMDSNPDNSKLIIANIATGNAKVIESLGDSPGSFQINMSPDNQIVAFFTENVSVDRQEIFPIGQNDENFDSFIVEGQNFQGKWSPNGDKILYSVFNPNEGYLPNLWIINKNGDFKKRITANTWSEKCTFYDNDIVYCGIPQGLDEMMGLSPNYSISKNDLIYRIDLNLNKTILVDTGNAIFNIKEIIVTDNEQHLYFTDRRTGRLYKIEL